jgi:hypothetical protein
MPTYYSYPTLSDPIDKGEVEANFSDLAHRCSALEFADFDTDAVLLPTHFARPYQELIVELEYQNVWVAAGTIVDYVPIPGSASDSPWYATDISWICTDIGDGNGKFNVLLGSFVGGQWTTVETLFASLPITANGLAVSVPNQVRAAEGELNQVPYSSSVRSVALQSAAIGAGVLALGARRFRIEIAFKRYLTTLG